MSKIVVKVYRANGTTATINAESQRDARVVAGRALRDQNIIKAKIFVVPDQR